MTFLLNHTYELISRRPGFIIALTVGIFLLCLGAFSNVEIADEIESGVADAAALESHRTFKEHFGNDQSMSLAWEIGAVNAATLLGLYDLVQEIKKIPEVRSVISILDLLKTAKSREEFAGYLQEFRLENLRKILAEDDFYQGFLISGDLTKTCLVILPDTTFPDYQRTLYKTLKDRLPELFGTKEYHLFGFMYFKERFFEFIARNNTVFLSMSLIVCGFLAFFFFPDLIIMGLILLSIAIPTVMTFAIYFYNGNKVNIFTSPIIPFSLIISLNQIIYIVSFFVREKNTGFTTYSDLHRRNFTILLRPCLVNTVTTLIGFFSLYQSPSENIRLFSLYTSLACFLSYFVTFGLVFAFLRLYQPAFSLSEHRNFRFQRWSTWIRNLSIRHPGKIVVFFLITAGLSFSFVGGFVQRNAIEDNFQADDPLLKSFHFHQSHFSGPYFLHMILPHDQVLSGDTLRRVEQFQEVLKTFPEVNRVVSIVDLVKKFTEYFSAGPEIPDSLVLTRSIVRFFADQGISEFFVSPAWNIILVRVSIGISDDFAIGRLGERIKLVGRDHLPPEVAVALTGEVYLNAILQKNIMDNITYSFALAIVMIVGVFFVVFRNVAQTLIALVINFYPIYLGFFAAGIYGIPFNASTLVVGCVMSGLIVDDTLHLLTFYHDSRQSTTVRRVIHLIREMTAPIMYSAILLGLGNAIFIFSPFKPFKYFGAIGTLIVIFGIIGDAIILPALLILLSRKKDAGTRPASLGTSTETA